MFAQRIRGAYRNVFHVLGVPTGLVFYIKRMTGLLFLFLEARYARECQNNRKFLT